jgi:hypothetical protein
MCIPPHWEHRRAEIDQLEPLDTVETMAGDTESEPAQKDLG